MKVLLDRHSLKILHIQVEHVTQVVQLPFHHCDPFDRLIIAQAQVEDIPIMGADKVFDAYGVMRMW